MSAQTLLTAIQHGATRFRLRGESGTWEVNSPINRRGRSWILRVHKAHSKVYAYIGSANARLWEALGEAVR